MKCMVEPQERHKSIVVGIHHFWGGVWGLPVHSGGGNCYLQVNLQSFAFHRRFEQSMEGVPATMDGMH